MQVAMKLYLCFGKCDALSILTGAFAPFHIKSMGSFGAACGIAHVHKQQSTTSTAHMYMYMYSYITTDPQAKAPRKVGGPMVEHVVTQKS